MKRTNTFYIRRVSGICNYIDVLVSVSVFLPVFHMALLYYMNSDLVRAYRKDVRIERERESVKTLNYHMAIYTFIKVNEKRKNKKMTCYG